MSALPTAGVPALAAGRERVTPLRDSWLMAVRDMAQWVREPQLIIWGLTFPVVSVLLFAFVFGSGIVVPDGGSYREFLMPGVFAQTIAFGIGETIAAVQSDTAKGVTDRLRSMPLSPVAVVAGRALANTIYSACSLLLLAITGLAIGWRWHGGLGNALAGFGLLLLLRISFLWVGIVGGLKARSAEMANGIFGLLWPLTILSNAFIATELMPRWLGVVASGTRCRRPSRPPGSCSATPPGPTRTGSPSTRWRWPSCGRW
jgi:ABC-2 type transport system permease protein